MNGDGTLLATASDKGTIIRVFSIPGAHKLYQFRRGSMPSRIFSMSFNNTSTLLCVSSATETVHIFKLVPLSPSAENPGSPNAPSSPTRGQALTRMPSSQIGSSGNGEPSDLAWRKHNGTFMGIIRRTSQNVGTSFATTVGGYLPKGVTEMWEPMRDFAWIKLPKSTAGSQSKTGPLRSVVAMSSNSPQVMVVTSEGNFYVYSIDLSKGGEGTLTKQYS